MNVEIPTLRIGLLSAILVFNFIYLSDHALAQATDLKIFNGLFSGELNPNGCRPGPAYMISGEIKDGQVQMKVMKGKTLDMKISEDGEFEGEAFLRSHKRGDKMQSYEGRVSDGKVTINATFGVPGYSQTRCTADGELPLVR